MRQSLIVSSLFAVSLSSVAQGGAMPHHATAARRSSHVLKQPVALAVRPAAPAAPAAATPAPLLRPTPFGLNPITTLHGSSRVLLVFAPNDTAEAYTRQLRLLDHHELELTERDTVFVNEVAQQHGPDFVYPGESVQAGSAGDKLSARQRFGLRDDQFAVILLNKNGVEQFRSAIPVSADALAAEIDENEAASSR